MISLSLRIYLPHNVANGHRQKSSRIQQNLKMRILDSNSRISPGSLWETIGNDSCSFFLKNTQNDVVLLLAEKLTYIEIGLKEDRQLFMKECKVNKDVHSEEVAK